MTPRRFFAIFNAMNEPFDPQGNSGRHGGNFRPRV